MRRDLLVGSERIRNPEEGESGGCFAAPFSLHDRADGTAQEGIINEFVAVEIFAAERDEKVTRLHRPGVGTQVGDDAFGRDVLPDGTGEMRDLFNRERVHGQCVPPALLLRA